MGLYNNEIIQYNIGKGYVALPSDIDRAVYIRDCYMNNQISVLSEDGGFMNRVSISADDLNYAEFPTDPKQLGSLVVYGVEEASQQVIVLKLLQSREQIGDSKEHQFKIRRLFGDSLVEISGSPKDGVLNLIVNGTNASGINLKVLNQSENSVLDIDVAGSIEVSASKDVSFTQEESFSIQTNDKDTEDFARILQSSTENKFYNKKMIVNDGDDPITLGKEMKDFMEEFLNEVSKITVTTMLGIQPILNKAAVLLLKKKLDSFLSKEVFVNK